MFKKVSISDRLIFFLFLLLVLVTPVIFTVNTNEMFEFPKMFFVYFVGTTAVFVFVLKTVTGGKKFELKLNFELLFVLAYVLSTIFSTHFYTSVWGYYTRFNGGLVSVLILFGLYIAAKSTFDKQKFADLLNLLIIPTIPVSLYAISQHYGIIENIWKSQPLIRAFSTFGQPNWLAAYISMLLPLILFKLLNLSGTKKLVLCLLFLINFSSLWFTYSISGLLGFAAGIAMLSLLNFNLFKSNLKALSLLSVAVILIALLNPGIFEGRIKDTFTDLRKFISVSRTVFATEQTTHEISDTGSIRNGLWRGTAKLIFSNPRNILIGTGPETFPYQFQKFRPRELNYTSEWDYIFNKPHNYYLELISNLGFIGFIPYALIAYKTVKKRRKVVTPMLFSFYVSNFFGWPTVYTAFLFWLLLAMLEVENA